MKKIPKTKLRLQREVVRALQISQLRQVDGGTGDCQPQSTDSQNACCS